MDARESIIARLEREKQQVLANLESLESAGECMPIVLDPSRAEQLGIQSVGRMVVDYGVTKIKFAPSEIDRDCPYKMQERDMFAFADAYARGDKAEVPSYMMQECGVPEIVKNQEFSDIGPLQKNLFDYLSSMGELVTLVNPSFGAMQSALGQKMGVYLTDTVEREWKKDIYDFISKSTGRISFYERPTKTTYLGSATPEHFVGEKWCYFLPDPYYTNKFSTFEKRDLPDGIVYSHVRKGRVVQSVFLDSMGCFVYSPATVKRHFKGEGYMLLSNFPLHIEGVEAKSFVHTPWFLDDWPERTYDSRLDRMVRQKDGYYYDIEDEGTYLSRRSRYKEEPWVTTREVGMVGYDRFTVSPELMGEVNSYYVEALPVISYGGPIVADYPLPVRCAAAGDHDARHVKDFRGVSHYVIDCPEAESEFEQVRNVLIPSGLGYREQHAYVEQREGHRTSLCPGFWYPLRQHNLPDGRLVVYFEPEIRKMARTKKIILFRDHKARKDYYMQHYMYSHQWSVQAMAMQVDDSLIGAKELSTQQKFMQVMNEHVAVRIQDVALALHLTHTQIFSLMSRLKRQVFLLTNEDRLGNCTIARKDKIKKNIPGDPSETYVNGKDYIAILEESYLYRVHRHVYKGNVKDLRDFVEFCRMNRVAVCVQEGDEECWNVFVST